MNQLHTFLAAGFVQAEPILGEPCTYQGHDYIGFFSAADDRLLMQTVGYLDESDTIAVISFEQFQTFGAPAPQENTLINRPDGVYSIRGVKTDQSAYVLTLKRLSKATPGPISPVPPGDSFGSGSYAAISY